MPAARGVQRPAGALEIRRPIRAGSARTAQAPAVPKSTRGWPDRRVLGLEVLAPLEAEHAGDHVGREASDLGVELADVGVVEPAARGDAVLGVGQLGPGAP